LPEETIRLPYTGYPVNFNEMRLLVTGSLAQWSWGIIFAAEGHRAVAAVPSSSKTMPQDLSMH